MKTLHHQQGIAMLTAIMIVALAVVVVTSIFVQQRYSVRLNTNIQDVEQAYQYAAAAEKLAGAWLEKDFEDVAGPGGKSDSAHDLWAVEIPPFEIDDDNGQAIGELRSEIEDLQAYFNINDLYDAKEKVPRPLLLKAFQSLSQTAGIPASFAYSVLDWMDVDDNLSDPDSAETDYYLSEEPASRAANDFLIDAAELGQIKMGGVTDAKEKQEMLNTILPFVVALPTPTSVNVNTAPAEVLEALGVTGLQAKAILELRKAGPILDTGALSAAVPGISGEALAVLNVSSNYFRLGGQVKLGKSRLFLNSVLFRSPEGKVHVIMRQFSRVKKPVVAETTGS